MDYACPYLQKTFNETVILFDVDMDGCTSST